MCTVQIKAIVFHQHCQNFDTTIKSRRKAIFLFRSATVCGVVCLSSAGLSLSFDPLCLRGSEQCACSCVTELICYMPKYKPLHWCCPQRGEREWWQAFWSSQWSSVLTRFRCLRFEVIISQHKSGLLNWFRMIVVLRRAYSAIHSILTSNSQTWVVLAAEVKKHFNRVVVLPWKYYKKKILPDYGLT